MTIGNHVDAARELAGLRRELESVSADRVQLEALYASSRDEVLSLRTQVHGLNNQLTAVTLERDALDRKCAALALLLYGNPLPHGNGV